MHSGHYRSRTRAAIASLRRLKKLRSAVDEKADLVTGINEQILEELTLGKSRLSESWGVFEKSLADLEAQIQAKETELAQTYVELKKQKLRLRTVQHAHWDETSRLRSHILFLETTLEW